MTSTNQPFRENLNWAWRSAKSVADRAKSTSPLVKFGLDSVERLSQPIVGTLIVLGDPLLARVDNFFAVNQDLKHSPTYIVESSWFSQVDNILGFQHFYKAATDQFRFLDKGDGNVPREEFLAGLKGKLSHFWDDGFSVIGDAFLTKVRSAYDLRTSKSTVSSELQLSDVFSKIQTQFQEVWELKIIATFQSAIVSPATYIYVAALDQYLAFDLENRKVSAKAFLAGMKARLGTSWNENLTKPLQEFLKGARKSALDDIIRIRAAIESNSFRSLTLGDVLDLTSKAVTTKVIPVVDTTSGLVNGAWRGLLQVTQESFDFFLPEQFEEKTSKGTTDLITLDSLRTHVSRRLKSKAEVGLHRVRNFSANRLKNLIHIDLIVCAEEVINKQKCFTKLQRERVQARLHQALLDVKQSLYNAKSTIFETVPKTNIGIFTKTVHAKMRPFIHNLREKLAEAVRRAKEVSAHGKDHILHQQLVKLPSDTVRFFLRLPFALQIVWEQDTYRSPELPNAIEKVQTLLLAIKEVVVCLVLVDTKKASELDSKVQKLEEVELINASIHKPVSETNVQTSPKELTEESEVL